MSSSGLADECYRKTHLRQLESEELMVRFAATTVFLIVSNERHARRAKGGHLPRQRGEQAGRSQTSSQNCLAVDHANLSETSAAVAVALDLPEDYFPEARLDFIIDRVERDPAARDRVYDQLKRAE